MVNIRGIFLVALMLSGVMPLSADSKRFVSSDGRRNDSVAATQVMKFVATETPFVLRSSRRMRSFFSTHFFGISTGIFTATSTFVLVVLFSVQATSFVTAVLSGNVATSRFVSTRVMSFVRLNGT